MMHRMQEKKKIIKLTKIQGMDTVMGTQHPPIKFFVFSLKMFYLCYYSFTSINYYIK